MTEEQRTRIRKVLYQVDGIEEAEEMIEAIEHLEENPLDEKIVTYIKWFENKFHKADQDRRMFLNQLVNSYKEVRNLYIALVIQSVVIISMVVYYFTK